MAEKKIYFEPKPDGPAPVRVAHAEYTREFQGGPDGSAGSPPWEAGEAEWTTYLLPTGLFREVNPKSKIQNPKSVKE